jgi:hypothetical protein
MRTADQFQGAFAAQEYRIIYFLVAVTGRVIARVVGRIKHGAHRIDPGGHFRNILSNPTAVFVDGLKTEQIYGNRHGKNAPRLFKERNNRFAHSLVFPFKIIANQPALIRTQIRDTAIRRQVMRDLQDKPPALWEEEQKLVAKQGWGARLLKYQDDSGRWTPKLYGQK